MSMSVPFDTLDYAKKLEQTGMPAAQAEQQSKVLADVLSESVALPSDLIAVERNLIAKVDAAELRIENRLITLTGEINLGKWMLATALAINLAIALKLFVH
jgi:hypothetical protein